MVCDQSQNTFSSIKIPSCSCNICWKDRYCRNNLQKLEQLPKIALALLLKKKKSQLTEYVWVCFYTLFCSIFYLSMLRPIPLPWLLYIYNEFWNQVKSSNFFFQHVLPILFYFHFCMYLEPSCLLLQNSMLPFWYKLHWMYISN